MGNREGNGATREMTKWKQEPLWVTRNDRGEIIRAQDDHPSVAIKVAEGIQAKVRRLNNMKDNLRGRDMVYTEYKKPKRQIISLEEKQRQKQSLKVSKWNGDDAS